MITYIKINGFKSFHNFEMNFTPFTIIAGVNASGKSNLFDALLLLSKLAESDNIKRALSNQRGEFIELFTMYDSENFATEMEFVVEILVNKKVKDAWGNDATLKYTRLRYELNLKRYTNKSGIEDIELTHESLTKLNHQDDKWIKIIPKKYLELWRPKVEGNRGVPYLNTESLNNIETVYIHQDGTKGGSKRNIPLINANRTVLSSIDTIDFKHILATKEEMKSWRFLQLNPEDLREPTNKNNGEDEMSSTGRNLAATLFRIKQTNKNALKEISRKLNKFIPNFTKVDVVDDKENRQYIIKLTDVDKKEYSSRVLSEGTLRILALCILEYDDKYTGLLCFEEPENGIHPGKIRNILDLLQDLSSNFIDETQSLRQIIVNTHSPVLIKNLNLLKKNNPLMSLWFSRMRKTILGEKQYKIENTKILEVDFSNQFSLLENKLTTADVEEYLSSINFTDKLSI